MENNSFHIYGAQRQNLDYKMATVDRNVRLALQRRIDGHRFRAHDRNTDGGLAGSGGEQGRRVG